MCFVSQRVLKGDPTRVLAYGSLKGTPSTPHTSKSKQTQREFKAKKVFVKCHKYAPGLFPLSLGTNTHKICNDNGKILVT
jgi:hypothetical protein